MIDELLKAIIGSDVDVGTEELVDILWLAARVDGDAGPSPADLESTIDAGKSTTAPQSAPTGTAAEPGDPLYTVGQPVGGKTETNKQGVRVRVRRAASLREPLVMMRALRPLGRRLNRGTGHTELDEEATVASSIEQHMLLPVFRPAEDRWLHVTIVVDTNSSMLLWHDLVQELRRTITQTGLFVSVRTWYLQGTDGEAAPTIAPRPGGAPRSPQEIASPSGRQLILVFTDTVADGWSRGSLHGVLRQWCAHSAVAVLNVLPERLWSSGAVHPVPLMLRSSAPAAPAVSWNRVTVRSRRRRPGAPFIAVPVIDTAVAGIADLAGLIAGDGAWRRMRCLRIEKTRSEMTLPPVSQQTRNTEEKTERPPDSAEALLHFRETASPTAQELAGYLSAVPLTLPVMNLVRQVMLPQSDLGHLAEVALSGLLIPWGSTDAAIDRLHLQFVPGVREALLGSQLRQDITTVEELVRRELSAYVAQRGGTAGDFAVTQSAVSGNVSIPAEAIPFANATSSSTVVEELTAEDPPVTGEGHLRVHTSSSDSADVVIRGRTYLFEDFPSTPPPLSVSVPSQLLETNRQVVPFSGRENELDALLTWWQNERELDHPSLKVYVIQGDGGQGKTRLAMTFADLVRQQGFTVWLTSPQRADGRFTGRTLAADRWPGRVLIVVDYADTWSIPALHELIDELVSHRGSSEIRLLLLARSAGNWLDAVVARLRRETITLALLPLHPLGDSFDARLRFFNDACVAFGTYLGLSQDDSRRITPSPELERDPAFDRVATIHAAALEQVLAVLGDLPQGAGTVSRRPTNQEDRVVLVAELSDPVRAGSRIAGAATGYALSSRLILTVAHVIPTDSSHTLKIRTMSGTVTATGWIGCHVVWTHPDLDAALLAVDEDILEPGRTEPLLPGLAEIQSATIMAFGDPAQANHPLGASRLSGTLRVNLKQSEYAFDSDVSLSGVEWTMLVGAPVLVGGGPVGIVVSSRRPRSRLRVLPLAILALNHDFASLVPFLRYRPAGVLEEAEETVRQLRYLATENAENFLPRLARALCSFGDQLAETNRRDETLAVRSEAVKLYRQLNRQRPDAYSAELREAMARLDQSRRTPRVGTIMAVDIVDYDSPKRTLEDLQVAQTGISAILRSAFADTGIDWDDCFIADRVDGAMILLPPGHEAILATGLPERMLAELRRYNAVNPAPAHIRLRMSLHTGTVHTDSDGLVGQAVVWAARLLEIKAAKAAQRRTAAVLAMIVSDTLYKSVVDNVTDSAADFRRIDVMVKESKAPAWLRLLGSTNEIRHELTGSELQDRRAVDPGDPGSLYRPSNRPDDLGHREADLAVIRESVDLDRRLADQDPDTHLPDLASSLNRLAMRLSDAGRRVEALTAAQESVNISRRLAKVDPGAHLPQFASSLNLLAMWLGDLGLREEALAAERESLDVGRRLTEMDHDAHLPQLASGAGNLTSSPGDPRRLDEAKDEQRAALAAHEQTKLADDGSNVAHWRGEEGDPAAAATAFEEPLADQLRVLGPDHSTTLVTRDEAIIAHEHDLAICQQLGDRHGEGAAWNNLGVALREVRRFDEAIAAHQQARDISQQLGDRHREGGAWGNLGNSLQAVRRFDEAIAAHQQARDISQQLGDRHREGTAWNNLGVALRQVRRFDEAIAAHQQARDIFQQLGDRHREGGAWGNLGLALREVRRFDDAARAWGETVAAYDDAGDWESAARVQRWLGDIGPGDGSASA